MRLPQRQERQATANIARVDAAGRVGSLCQTGSAVAAVATLGQFGPGGGSSCAALCLRSDRVTRDAGAKLDLMLAAGSG
jgi:hypothetical protein